jgi:chromosome partitioning protein
MKVIAVLNQKGGSGKTTIATNLARAFQIEGLSVVLVDSDPQGSARDWSAARENQPLSVIGIDRPTIERDLKSLAKTDYAIIDGAPQAADLAISAIKASNFILIPVQPSPYDIWATAALVDLVKQRIEMTDGKLQAAFVVSRAISGTNLSNEIADTLAGYELPVLNTRITQRVIYPGTAVSGLTAFDSDPNGEAAKDFIALKNEIELLLK